MIYNVQKAFPHEIMNIPNWCVWKYTEVNGRMTKIPFNPLTGEKARSNDSSTWVSFNIAKDAYIDQTVDGLGFFFEEPYVGIDLDDVEDEIHRFKRGDHTDNIVSEFHEAFKSYSEISPSGTGIHIIVRGNIPGERRRKGNVEIYEKGRFFTMTGHTLGKYYTVTSASKNTMQRIYDKYLKPKTSTKYFDKTSQGIAHNLSESEVVAHINNSKQSDLFNTLMHGSWEGHYTSQSDADMAFANLLAFWCAKDFDQMDSLFRQSNLYRNKWDSKRGDSTYGEQTLYKAINEVSNIYTPTNKQEPLKYVFGEAFGTEDKSEKKEYPPQSWDDTGNANRFVDRYGDNYKYSYTNKQFYVFDGAKWSVDETGMIRRLIDEMIENLKFEKIKVPDGEDPEEFKEEFQKFIKKTRGTTSKKNIADEIKHRKPVKPDEFDQDDMLLNVANGYLDLPSRTLHDHDINKLFSLQSYTDYTEKMQPTIWLEFLNDIFDGDESVIHYLQKALGYSLTGSTREQVMFILHGKGRNGKSIFVETIAEILGDYAMTMQASSLMVKKSESVNTDIARLNGARFVSSSEPNEGFRFDEGLVKQLTGGDKVTARFLYGSEFEFTPKFKIWVSTNHKPVITGTDDGIWRRLVLIPFDVQIPDEKVDKNLKYKLLREAPAILDWMVQGAYLWMKEGLQAPDKISDASMKYRNEMDVLEHFIEDNFIRNENSRSSANEVFELYKKWADNTGEYKMNKNNFGKKMKEKFEWKRTNTGIVYFGIEIKQTFPGLNQLM